MVNVIERDVTELQARALAARHGDVGDYSKAVHDWETEPYQDAWAEAVNEDDRLVIICPPDTFKSSTIQCTIEQMIGLNPDVRILWLMKAGAQAQARVADVAETIEDNNVFRTAFPGTVPNKEKGWSKTMLYVKRNRDGPDPTLMGCGFNGPYQGFHFDVIVIDDPTNQEDVRSPTTMMSQRTKLRGVILDRLTEGGRIVAIFTRWGEDDLLPTFKEMGFRVVTMPIISDKYPWGPTISNRRFPMERCRQIRHDKTDVIFDLTYMCDPLAMDGGIIRRSYLKYFSYDPNESNPEYQRLPQTGTISLMAVDPAASTRNWADPSAIGTGVLELATRTLYIPDIWAGRVEIQELESEIKKRAARTANLTAIGLETKGFQLSFFQKLRRENKLPIRELPYRTRRQAMNKANGLDNDKTGRAIMVAQEFLNNRLFLAQDLPYVDGVSVESELCGFPFSKHDDRLDVIAFLVAMAQTYAGPRWKVKMGHN